MKKPRKKKNYLNNNWSRYVLMGIIALLGLKLIVQLDRYSRDTKTYSYGQFLNLVEEGKVKDVFITGQDVVGHLKDDTSFEAVLGENQKNWDILRAHGVDINVVNPATQFNWWYLILIALAAWVLWMAWNFFQQARGGSGGAGGGNNIFSIGKSRAKLFMPKQVKEKFSSVAGVAEAKEELQDIIDFLKNPEKYKRLGAKITRGVLLSGQPGNGKTLLAKAVAGEANVPFLSASGSDFIEVFVGVGASRIRDLFAQARKHAPSIIFIDEIDAVGRQRGSGLGGGNDEREQTLNQLLAEMDGFQTGNESVIVLAATNRANVLDKALLRPGRFDRKVHVPYPDLASRLQILKVHAKPVKISEDVNLEKIARGTPGFSGADLASLINEAAILASKNNQESVTTDDFEEARDKILLGKQVKTMKQTKEDLEITAYHEAGHALVNLLVPDHTDPLHKVTILPRGGALGVTHSLPEREKYTQNKQEIIAKIMVASGGRAAEEIVFDSQTTGASSDFENATRYAYAMVSKFGMSDLGPVVYNESRDISQKTAEKIDEEVRKIIQKYYDKTVQLLKDNRDKLDLLAKTLLEKETLYAGEVYELLGIEPRAEHSFS